MEPKVLVIGSAFWEGSDERYFGPNVYTLDVLEVHGTSDLANDARSRHFQVDLNNSFQIGQFIQAHRSEFSQILFDWSVWKFVDKSERWRMVALLAALKPGGKLYILGVQTPSGGIIDWVPPGKTPWDFTEEQQKAMRQAVLDKNVQEAVSYFTNRQNVQRLYYGPFLDILSEGKEDAPMFIFQKNSKNIQRILENNDIMLVVQKTA